MKDANALYQAQLERRRSAREAWETGDCGEEELLQIEQDTERAFVELEAAHARHEMRDM